MNRIKKIQVSNRQYQDAAISLLFDYLLTIQERNKNIQMRFSSMIKYKASREILIQTGIPFEEI